MTLHDAKSALVIATALACACGAPRTANQRPTVTQAAPSVGRSSAARNAPSAVDQAGSRAKPAASAQGPKELTARELSEWLKAHSIVGAFPDGDCWTVRIGVPSRDGLICVRPLEHPFPNWSNMTSNQYDIWRMADGAMSLVWSARRNWGDYVALAIDVSADGSGFTLHETEPDACDSIYGQAFEHEEIGDPRETESIYSFCLERGRYVWDGATFIRDPKQPLCPPNDPRAARWPCPE